MSTLRLKRLSLGWAIALGLAFATNSVASPFPGPTQIRHQSVPILGVTLNQAQQPVGIVMYVMIHFQKRSDHDGLKVQFRTIPGRFGPLARKGVATAIDRAAKAAHLQDDSWTVVLEFPYSGLTMDGDSLSAMVALSTVALAKGEAVQYGRTLTGTITEDGQIGTVTGIPYKVYAAYSERLDRVLIPDEPHPLDGEWRIPFLMHVSHVGTLEQAYQGLTDHPLFSKTVSP
jgi:Lon protease (S16) C-terminal proteolytic domain